MLGIILVFSPPIIALVKLPLNFDDVRAREVNVRAGKVFDSGWIRGGRLDVSAYGTVRHTRLGLSRKTAGPYRFKICAHIGSQEVLTLKQAKLTRLEMGQVKLVDAGFNLDPAWAKPYSGPEPEQHTRRADDFLVLDVEIESQEIYCVDTSFDLREDERVEQTCLRFTRKFSGYRVTLWELFVGWFVYSA